MVRWMRERLQRRKIAAARQEADRGSQTAELVVWAPVIVVLVLLVVGLGRYAHGKQLVEQAAMTAARAASLTSDSAAATRAATEAGDAALRSAGVSCTDFTVDVDAAGFRPGGSVAVTVRCTATLADLAMDGFPGTTTMTTSATVPLEQFRQYGSGG